MFFWINGNYYYLHVCSSEFNICLKDSEFATFVPGAFGISKTEISTRKYHLSISKIIPFDLESYKSSSLFMQSFVNQGRLPVKWTAYEALMYGTYTTKSDV